MKFDFVTDDLIRVILSIICGSVIGFEREYRNKSAGFRTLILICLGSTIFTIVSLRAPGASDDRIAANIITGIGFIGAGVIFKDGLSVKGLTTAAVIWVVAALGMVVGIFHYSLSIILTIMVLLVLSLFNKIEVLIDFLHHQKRFKIGFCDEDLNNLLAIESSIESYGLKCRRLQLTKGHNRLRVVIEVSGRKQALSDFNQFLVTNSKVVEVES